MGDDQVSTNVDSAIAGAARAFSSHRFAEAYPHLLDTVRWTLIGGDVVTGRDAVTARCDASAAYLAGVTTTFKHFKEIVGADNVVIDSWATYVESNGETTAVASCDIYDVAEGKIAAITSYTVDVTGQG